MIDTLLSRIGLRSLPAADVDGLHTLHRAYLETVPYEDLAVQLEETGPLDFPLLASRVASGRGGYCFELNTVLAGLLRACGFEVTHHQAVVGGDGPTNHMVLLVQIGGDTWIADAGLGEGFLDPLPLREGSYEIGPFTWSLTSESAGTWWLTHHEWGSFSGFRMSPDARKRVRPLALVHAVLARADERETNQNNHGFDRNKDGIKTVFVV